MKYEDVLNKIKIARDLDDKIVIGIHDESFKLFPKMKVKREVSQAECISWFIELFEYFLSIGVDVLINPDVRKAYCFEKKDLTDEILKEYED